MGIKTKIIKTIEGAKETVNLMKATGKANKEAKKNVNKIAIQLAQKNNIKKTGKPMLPSTLKSEQDMGMMSEESKEYLKDKKKIKKSKLEQYGL